MLSVSRQILITLLAISALLAPSAVQAADDDEEDPWEDEDTEEEEQAQEGDFDQLERVLELQRQALAAARIKDWDRARLLAEVVLTLDDSEFTAGSRLVLVQALESEDQYGAALYELKQYLDLPQISPSNLRRGERIQKRLNSLREAELTGEPVSGRSNRKLGQPKVASAVGVLLGGIALSVTGSYLIGVDINWQTQGVRSGTWAAIGTPLLAFGVSLDIAGLVLLGKARRPQASSADFRRFERRPRLALSWNSQQLSFSLGAAW
jgi:hypothetical protein